MPYYVHSKDEPLRSAELLATGCPWQSELTVRPVWPEFTDRAAAHAASNPKTDTVSFLPTIDENIHWLDREYRRSCESTYIRVPWDTYSQRLHFAHLSTLSPGMVVYTPSDEYGVQDRQIRTKPGRYLEQFYADVYSKERRDQFAHECASSASTEWKIARSIDDIRTLYMSKSVGFSSCMQAREHADYRWQALMDAHKSIDHPCAVCYGDSDLGVAYRGDINRPSQRAVVFVDKKEYCTVYGSGPLGYLLQMAGYTEVSGWATSKPRIRRVQHPRGGYYMPYVDGASSASATRDGAYWQLCSGQDVVTQITDGHVRVNGDHYYGGDDDDVDDQYQCTDCRGMFDGLDNDDRCEDCAAEYWTCDDCGNELHNNHDAQTAAQNGESLCESCVSARSHHCTICQNTFCEETVFTRRQSRQRDIDHLTDLCEDCAEYHAYCEQHRIYFDTDDHQCCPSCNDDEAALTPDTPSNPAEPIVTNTAEPIVTGSTGLIFADTSDYTSPF